MRRDQDSETAHVVVSLNVSDLFCCKNYRQNGDSGDYQKRASLKI